ncbi:hypothetical protein [Micromonospora sp. CPCC 206061]|uniref:hypothetical protein n=1 Tax=Micromonospora sp. CPCC 206061 TaxID=3122410 RepID=UPI002FF308F1
MRILVRGFMAVAVIVAALLVTAAPARADDCPYPCWWTDTKADAPYKTAAGSAFFDSYGEHLYIYDNASDHAGVRVYFSVNKGGWQQRTNSKGSDEPLAHWNLDYAENLSFRFYVCISNNGTNIAGTCGPTIYAHT